MWEMIIVWRKHDASTVACYRIYRSITTQLFSVQSLDYIRTDKDLTASEVQNIELFLEDSPDSRSPGYSTIEDAISAFDAEFSN